MQACRAFVLLTVLLLSAAASSPAQPTSGGSVVVTVVVDGAPLPGAFVVLVGSGANRYGGVTGPAGTLTLTGVAGDSYIVRTSAPATTVGSQLGVVVPEGGVTNVTIAVTRSATGVRGLRIDGAEILSIAADGRSGVFYLHTNSIPSLYRTADYGGTWAPVTITSDDQDEGIDGSKLVASIATSGYPGEVAALTSDKVWYSRDFGVTWSSIALPALPGSPGPNGEPPADIYWAHPRAVGATSMMFLVAHQTRDIYYFDVEAGFFAIWTSMVTPYKQNAGDRITFANGENSVFAAVVPSTGGSATLYRVGATPDATTDPSTGVMPNLAPAGAPGVVRLGGPLTGQVLGGAGGASPNTLFVYSNTATTPTFPPLSGNGAAVLSTFAGGNWTPTSVTQFRNEFDDLVQAGQVGFNIANGRSCDANDAGHGSIAPVGRFAAVGRCALEQSGATLIVRPVTNAHRNGFVFDTEYGSSSGNLVIIAADASGKGAIKSDRTNLSLARPEFPAWPVLAAPGFSLPPHTTTHGGTSINGVTAAVVSDLAFSPTSVQNAALVMANGGGSRVVGSADGGQTWFTLETRGGGALDWWSGSGGGQWIAMGSTSSGTDAQLLLSAIRLPTPAHFNTSTTTAPLAGTEVAAFGLSGRNTVRSLVGLAGTDTIVMAIGRDDGTAARVSAVALDPTSGGLAASPVALASFATGTLPTALAYCPATGSAASVADKLFVAVAASTDLALDGMVLSISGPGGATPGSPTPLAGATTGNFRDVRVDCASGTLYAARYVDASTTGLLKGTTTGAVLGAFAPVQSLPNVPGRERIETVDVTPGNPNQVVVVTSDGSVFSTSDGGTSFSVMNDATTSECPVGVARCGRRFSGVGDVEIAASAPADSLGAATCPQLVCAGDALIGTSDGVYSTAVSLAPGAPTNLSIRVSGFTATMTWAAPAGGAQPADYVLDAALDNAFTQIVLSGAPIGSATAATVTAPSNAIGVFYIRVRARNENGISAPSNVVAITLPSSDSVPGTPGTPQVMVNPDNTVVVTWTAPATGATPTAYRVYLGTPSGPFPGTPVTLPALTAIASPFPLPALAYTLRVSAVAGSVEGPLSAPASFTISCALPAAPVNFTIAKLGGMNARLEWTAASGAASYQVQVSLDPAFSAIVVDANVGSTTVIDASAMPGTFYVRVLGRNACGAGSPSNVAVVTFP